MADVGAPNLYTYLLMDKMAWLLTQTQQGMLATNFSCTSNSVDLPASSYREHQTIRYAVVYGTYVNNFVVFVDDKFTKFFNDP